MDTIQTSTFRREDNRCKAITELIESVAEEQEALARILEAEHKKIEKAADLCNTDVRDLVRIDDSVERVLAAVTRLDVGASVEAGPVQRLPLPGYALPGRPLPLS